MAKLINAPYLKQQDNNPFNEVYIIAGADAFNPERKKMILEWTKAEPSYQPIILDSKKLAEIDRLRICPESKKAVSIFLADSLTEKQKTAICLNLAKHTQAEAVKFINAAMEAENVSDYIRRLREGDSTVKLITQSHRKAFILPDLSQDKPTDPELAQTFLDWHEQPIRRDIHQKRVYLYLMVHFGRI